MQKLARWAVVDAGSANPPSMLVDRDSLGQKHRAPWSQCDGVDMQREIGNLPDGLGRCRIQEIVDPDHARIHSGINLSEWPGPAALRLESNQEEAIGGEEGQGVA